MEVEASGDELVLSVSREYFVENGIPVEYYDEVQKQLDSNNAFIENVMAEYGLLENDWEKDLQEMHENYLKYMEEEGVEGMSYHEYSKREFIKRTREMGIDIDSVMP